MRSSTVAIGDNALASQYNNLRLDAFAAAHLLPHEQTTPDLTIKVESGVAFIGITKVVYAGGNSPSFTAPTTNPRIDLLTIDNVGVLARVVGTEAASPSIPAYPTDKVVLCEVFNRVGQTTIRDSDVAGQGYIQRDVRPFLGGTYVSDNSQVAAGANISASKLNTGNIDATLLPDADNTRDFGSASRQWKEVRSKAFYRDGEQIGGSFFGDGAEGALSATTAITINATKTNVDASSASGQTVLNVAATTGFAVGDHVFIHQTQGTGAGLWEIGKIASISAGVSLTMVDNLKNTYQATGAQVLKIPEYTKAEFKSGASVADAAWDGTTGGIAVLYSKGAVIVRNGVTISMKGKGFRGGASGSNSAVGTQGEGETGVGTASTAANGIGAGGAPATGNGGAGGGHFGAGGNNESSNANPGLDATVSLTTYLTGGDAAVFMLFGGGGSGSSSSVSDNSGSGARGGGILILIAPQIVCFGELNVNGDDGTVAQATYPGTGAGAAGSLCLFTEAIAPQNSFDTQFKAIGGTGGNSSTAGDDGGNGAKGIIHIGYPIKLLPQA